MQIYTIIGGVNGCGKSSLTGALKAERSDLGLLIDVDKAALQLFRKKLGGQSTTPILLCKTAFFPALLDAGKIAVRKIDECLEKGISFTQETTLSGARTERTIRRAKERGYTIRLYYIGLDTMEESLGRIANRVAKGGHDIPKRTWSAASKAALRTCCAYSPIAMRPVFSTTTTALWRWRSTATGS